MINMKHTMAILASIVAGLLFAAERPATWAVKMDRAGLPNLHKVDAKLYRVLCQGWKVEDAIAEMKDGGYGYHAVWFHLPRFIRRTAKELK